MFSIQSLLQEAAVVSYLRQLYSPGALISQVGEVTRRPGAVPRRLVPETDFVYMNSAEAIVLHAVIGCLVMLVL